jgi:hypothetical protein
MQAQEAPVQSATDPAKFRIYLSGFAGEVEHLTAGATDLKTFVDSYVYLRLWQIPNARIMREPPDSTCGQEPNALRHAPHQAVPESGESPSFYTVRGTLEMHPRAGAAPAGADELVINYEVLKTVRCAPQVLLRRGEPISQLRFLDSMSVIADAIAFRVGEDAAKRIRVDIKTVTDDKSGPDEAEFAQALTSYLVNALAVTDDLQPNNADSGSSGGAEYALEAHVSFPRSANLLKGFARNTEISLYVLALSQGNTNVSSCSANPHCYTLSPTPIRGTSSQRPQIFATAADIA